MSGCARRARCDLHSCDPAPPRWPIPLATSRVRASWRGCVGRLAQAGEGFSEAALRNKVSRGSFTADFFLSVLAVMNVDTLRLTD